MEARETAPGRDWLFARLDPALVEPSDETFRIRRRHRPQLLASVRERGIRTPLIAQLRGGRYRIVSGWGRWLGRTPRIAVPCFVLPCDLPAEEAWDVYLRDNDAWNAVEIARVLAALEKVPGLDEERIVREKLPLLGIHASRDLYRRYRGLVALGPAAQDLVEEESLPLRKATALLRLPVAATERIVAVARALRLTLSELGEMIEMVEEIAAREGAVPSDVIARIQEASRGRGKQAFRDEARALRYPELNLLRARLEECRSRLRFSGEVRVEWDPLLERPGIRILAGIPDLAALDAFRTDLDASRPGLGELLELL